MPRFPGRVAEAKPGETLVSNTVYAAAGLKLDHLERHQLDLKGKGNPVGVQVTAF